MGGAGDVGDVRDVDAGDVGDVGDTGVSGNAILGITGEVEEPFGDDFFGPFDRFRGFFGFLKPPFLGLYL